MRRSTNVEKGLLHQLLRMGHFTRGHKYQFNYDAELQLNTIRTETGEVPVVLVPEGQASLKSHGLEGGED